MDPGYSHAYPSSHRRSQSKIAIPSRPSSRPLSLSSLSSLQEPLLILVASNLASAYATLGVDKWGLKNGLDPVVLVCGSFALGAGWGWARGRARWDLVGKMWTSLLAYSVLHTVQYLAFYYALNTISPLRLAIFTLSTSVWSTTASKPTSSILGTLAVLASFVISFYSAAAASSMPNLLSHASVLIYLVCSAFKTSAYEQSLVSRFAISQGSGSETLKTLSLTLGSATLLPIVMIGSVLGFFPSSLSALSLSSGTTSLQQSLYALVLSQVIVAHPAILATPASTAITGGLNSRITYPVSLTIAALVGCFLWGVGLPDKVDYATAGLMTIAVLLLPVQSPSSISSRSVSSSSATSPITSPTNRMFRTYLKTILDNPESRKIFQFLLLNLAYMLVQMVWGITTNSLGLISDAIHMFFDCMALGVGLFASVMATWKPNESFTYGYGRVETLSGFANGVFLILISIFIVFEAIQRIVDPPEMNTSQLLLVSAIGLGINLFGMFATGGHAHHGHSHGGHSHSAPALPKPAKKQSPKKPESPPKKASSHSHTSHEHSHSHSHAPAVVEEKRDHEHSGHSHPSVAHSHSNHSHTEPECSHDHGEEKHDHSHAHSHSTDTCDDEDHDHDEDSHDDHGHSHNMQGVFLHVLADTLGSVGVIGSTLLVNHTGWTGWDPIASLFIAALIIASVIPLVIDAGKILCLDVGESREKDVRLALSELSTIEGLASYASPRFWPNDESTITGSIHIQLARLPSSDPGRPADGVSQGYVHPVQHANLEKVVNRVNALLKKRIRGLKELTVQVETEEQGMGRRG